MPEVASPVRSPTKTNAAREAHGPRVDPPQRSLSGHTGWMFGLKNKDPNRHYVWANNGETERGLEFYLELGYQIENWSEKGVAAGGTRGQVGSPITRQGQTLVSIDAARRAQIEQYGIDGEGGQALADQYQIAITAKDAGKKLLSGLQARGATGAPTMMVSNQTTELTPELDME